MHAVRCCHNQQRQCKEMSLFAITTHTPIRLAAVSGLWPRREVSTAALRNGGQLDSDCDGLVFKLPTRTQAAVTALKLAATVPSNTAPYGLLVSGAEPVGGLFLTAHSGDERLRLPAAKLVRPARPSPPSRCSPQNSSTRV
jgi:hypothetical protein